MATIESRPSRHLMQASALQALRRDVVTNYHNAHGRITLAVYVAGSSTVRKGRTNVVTGAFKTVAEDVLGYMHDQGLLVQDEMGWYYLAPGIEPLDGPTSLLTDRN